MKRGKRTYDDKAFVTDVRESFDSNGTLSVRQLAALKKTLFRYEKKLAAAEKAAEEGDTEGEAKAEPAEKKAPKKAAPKKTVAKKAAPKKAAAKSLLRKNKNSAGLS